MTNTSPTLASVKIGIRTVRTMLSTSLRAGAALDVVQALLGHASLASTTVYLHARDEDKRRAVETVAAGRRYR
jgi:integrase/recombinase XerD